MRKPNGDKILAMPEIIDIDEEKYLLRDAWVNTDEEYFNDLNDIGSVFLDNLVVESGDDITITICDINTEDGLTTLELYNTVNGTSGFITLNDTYLSDDTRYCNVHQIANIYRERGIEDATFYWYLWRYKVKE